MQHLFSKWPNITGPEMFFKAFFALKGSFPFVAGWDSGRLGWAVG
jgi:hypothetical protein